MADGTYKFVNYEGDEMAALFDKFNDLGPATQAEAGLMSAADKTKLDGISEGAEENVIEGVKLGDTELEPSEKVVIIPADNTPTEGSSSLIRSGGVAAAIADFITKSVNDLTNYYLKSETYTKAEVQALIAAIKQFSYRTADTLPEASADTMYIIYLIPSTYSQAQNVKDEFITVENNGVYSWEQIGSTAIDLSGYVTDEDLTAALADYTTTTDLEAMLDEKADKEGEYPALVAGSAQGLVGVAETSMEFLSAELPESAGTGAALLKAVKGKSIVWNQLVAPGATEVATISGHKYLTHIGGVDAIVISTGEAIAISDASADNVHDLTLLDLGDLTIAQFRALFPRTDYAYNPGEVLPFAGERLRTTGVNQWDGVTESGYWDAETGQPMTGGRWVRSKNDIPCFPNTSYFLEVPEGGAFGLVLFYDADGNYLTSLTSSAVRNRPFTTPSNTYIMKFYGNMAIDFAHICLNLSNPAINGQYFPYETHDLALNPATIKDKDGNLVFPYGGMHGKGTAFDAFTGLVNGSYTKGRRVWDRRAYTTGDESDASVITDGSTYTFTQLATPVEVELETPVPATFPVQQGGTLAVLPENTDEPYTAPASIVVNFPLGTSSIISKGTLTNLLEAMKAAGVITAYTMTYDASTGDYTFTITK